MAEAKDIADERNTTPIAEVKTHQRSQAIAGLRSKVDALQSRQCKALEHGAAATQDHQNTQHPFGGAIESERNSLAPVEEIHQSLETVKLSCCTRW